MRKISVRRESAGKNEDLYDPRFVDYRRGPMLSLAALGQCRFKLIEKTGKSNSLYYCFYPYDYKLLVHNYLIKHNDKNTLVSFY